jgi:hypothetical protein
MPPEQARGDLARLDERADVFALGAVLCEILTGRRSLERGGEKTYEGKGDWPCERGRR